MKEDLERMEYLPGNYYNFHPGSHMKQGTEAGIEMISEALNDILWEDMHTTVLLETMAGKGTEVGRSFEEIESIIEKVNVKDHIGLDAFRKIVNHPAFSGLPFILETPQESNDGYAEEIKLLRSFVSDP